MSANQNEDELIELAGQLRCPSGERGIVIANNMDFTNANLIARTIESLGIENNDKVLEIGPGNAAHVWKVLEKASGVNYQGIDISETMIAEAEKLNKNVANVLFRLTDGKTIPFDTEKFDKIFTTNTIYFWEDPQQYLQEIARVLKTDGALAIGFIPKRIMEHIPFSKHGFTLYEEKTVKNLLQENGFTITTEVSEREIITGAHSEDIEREFVITTAKKV